MEFNRGLFLSLVIFSCYLIFSLTFVSAYQSGGGLDDANARRAMFIMEPVVKMLDDIKPISCDSSGFITFRAYVENVAEYNVTASKAWIEDRDDGKYYDVSTAMSCTPRTKLISNEEITCRLNVKEALSRIPSCPLENSENTFYLSFDISYDGNEANVIDSRSIVISGTGVRPSMEVKFDVSTPPYPVPDINCRTGSEIEVPVVIHNAETLPREIEWSFSVNKISSSVIECSKLLSRFEGGRDDIYTCALTVPSTIFQDCESGGEVPVVIDAYSGDYKLSGNFSAFLTSSELSLSLAVSPLQKFKCQIIDEAGTCVPLEPQANLTVTISGNVPDKLSVFESRYSLGGNLTTLICKKSNTREYVCMFFVTLDKLGPSGKSEIKSKDRELTVFLDVKYMNYYKNISATTNVTLEGKVINDVLNTQNVLKKDKGFLDWIANSNLQGALSKAIRTLNFINRCCIGVTFVTQIIETGVKEGMKEAVKQAVLNFIKTSIIGSAQSVIGRVLEIIGNVGPNMLTCLARAGSNDISKEMQNLQKFENKDTISPSDLNVPTLGETIQRHLAGCAAQAFWSSLKGWLWGFLCGFVLFLVMIFTGGAAVAPIAAICQVVTGPLAVVGIALNLLMIVISALIMINMFMTATHAMTIARERMAVQLNATNILADYNGAFSQTIESMISEMSVNAFFQNLTDPSYGMGTIKLMFNSTRSGILNSGDQICSGDMVTIDYDLEKLGRVSGFIPELMVTNSRAKTLAFNKLKGVYGPYATDALLGTDPRYDKSEEYTFTLRYGNKNLDYKLNYVNTTCV